MILVLRGLDTLIENLLESVVGDGGSGRIKSINPRLVGSITFEWIGYLGSAGSIFIGLQGIDNSGSKRIGYVGIKFISGWGW